LIIIKKSRNVYKSSTSKFIMVFKRLKKALMGSSDNLVDDEYLEIDV